MEQWTEYSRFLVALLVILDPFSVIPIFLGLTQGYSTAERHKVSFIAALTVLFVLIIVAMVGESMLIFLGTSLASFRVGGGLVLLMMAFNMLRAQPDRSALSSIDAGITADKHGIAVVPLAIPLLAGPGAISTVIIEMHRSTTTQHLGMVISCILLVALVLWVALSLAVRIGKYLGPFGLTILTRLFGLILAAIAVEIIANGLRSLFPSLVA